MNNKSCQYSPLKELLIRHSSCKVYVCEREFTICVHVYGAACPSVCLSVGFLLDVCAVSTEILSVGILDCFLFGEKKQKHYCELCGVLSIHSAQWSVRSYDAEYQDGMSLEVVYKI